MAVISDLSSCQCKGITSDRYQAYHRQSTVFDDLAHQVVHVCISSLLKATEMIKTKKSLADGQLFLLKHLLLLKEQIVAFDIEFVQPDVDIDFSSVTSTFWEIREKGSLFNPNNLLKLVQNGMPRVVENMLDAKVVSYMFLPSMCLLRECRSLIVVYEQ